MIPLLRHQLWTKKYLLPSRTLGETSGLDTFGPSFYPAGNGRSAPGVERMMEGLGKQRSLPSDKEDKLIHIKPVDLYANMTNSEFIIRIIANGHQKRIGWIDEKFRSSITGKWFSIWKSFHSRMEFNLGFTYWKSWCIPWVPKQIMYVLRWNRDFSCETEDLRDCILPALLQFSLYFCLHLSLVMFCFCHLFTKYLLCTVHDFNLFCSCWIEKVYKMYPPEWILLGSESCL